MSELKEVSSSKCFEGHQKVFEHDSKELGCKMKFAIYIPEITNGDDQCKFPIVYFLSGLTCTEQNMITKSGFQRYASKHKLVVVGPDTSPRNCNVPGEDENWNFGTGAGFYVDATQQPWSKNYRMYSYVTKELRELIARNFSFVDCSRAGITGHSMGGHGALVCFLRNPQCYKAVSAFAPIGNPIKSPWGRKCLGAYLGSDESTWSEYDATELVKRQPQKDVTILCDQGEKDEWWSHLMPDNFVDACKSVGQPIEYKLREGYDHGYYYVSTYIEYHMEHFAKILYEKK